jgi:hypothetical protein
MADSKTYQTALKIVGNVDPALLASIKQLVGANARVIKQSVDMGRESKKGFDLMGKGAQFATGKLELLATTMKAVLLPILGLTAIMKVFTGINDTISGSISKYEAYRDRVNLLKGVIGGSDLVTKHGYDPAKLLAQYTDASGEIAKEQGGIFGKGFYTGVQTSLAEVGLGPQLTKPLTEALTSFAAMRKGTVKDLTSDDVKEWSDMVGMAIKAGDLGRIGRQFGLNTAQAKAFKAAAADGNKALEVQIILQGTQFKAAQKVMDQLSGPVKELMQARVANAAELNKLGGKWVELQEKGETAALELGTAFMPILEDLGDIASAWSGPVMQGLHTFTEGVKGTIWWIEYIPWYLKKYWKDMLNDAMGDPASSGKNLWDGIVTSFNSAIEGIKKAWTDSKISEFFSTGWSQLANNKDLQGIVSDLQGIGRDILSMANSAKEVLWPAFQWTFNEIKGSIEMVVMPALRTIGEYTFGVAKGALQDIRVLLDGIKGLADAVAKAFEGIAKALGDWKSHPQTPETKAAGEAAERKAMEGGKIPGDLTLFARGGMVERPTLGIVGEAGPEIVSPIGMFDRQHGVSLLQLDESKKANANYKEQLAQLNLINQTLQQGGLMGGGGGGAGAGGDIPQGSIGGRTLGSFGYIGDGTPDSNSLKGVGAYNSHMIPGYSAGLSRAAQMKWGIKPGQIFSIGGHTFRLDDTDNSGGQENYVDVYNPFHAPDPGHGGDASKMIAGHPESWWFAQRMGKGGIVNRATRALLGESGKEAVIPLSRTGMAKHGLAGSNFSTTFAPNITVYGAGPGVADLISETLERDFGRYLERSYQEHERRRFS